MVGAAETRARELARNAEMIWRERRRLIDDMRAVGDQLVAIGETEGAKRFAQFGEDGELLPETAVAEPAMPEAPMSEPGITAPVGEPTVTLGDEQPAVAAEDAPPV
jgi:hypothetical protein